MNLIIATAWQARQDSAPLDGITKLGPERMMMNLIGGLVAGTLLSAGLTVNVLETGNGQAAGPAVSATSGHKESGTDLRVTLMPVRLNDALASKPNADEPEQPAPKKRKPLKRRVLVVKASWCGACQALNAEWPKLRKVRWRVGEQESDHFQLVDSDEHPEIVQKYRVGSLPTLILIEDGRELDRRGYLNARNMAEFYYGRL